MIVAFGGISLAAAALVRPSRPTPAKLQSYECGPEPVGPAWIRFPVGFYLVALVFIVFDALVVFLFPWALVLRALGWAAFGPMALFLRHRPRLALRLSRRDPRVEVKPPIPARSPRPRGRRSRTSRNG